MVKPFVDPEDLIDESNSKVGLLTSGLSGIASGIIKVPKGIFS